MKKFLSILLAVMMVLSTVSFAAPSLADVADTTVEAPVEEVADLAGESTAATTRYLKQYDFTNADITSAARMTVTHDAENGWAKFTATETGGMYINFTGLNISTADIDDIVIRYKVEGVEAFTGDNGVSGNFVYFVDGAAKTSLYVPLYPENGEWVEVSCKDALGYESLSDLMAPQGNTLEQSRVFHFENLLQYQADEDGDEIKEAHLYEGAAVYVDYIYFTGLPTQTLTLDMSGAGVANETVDVTAKTTVENVLANIASVEGKVPTALKTQEGTTLADTDLVANYSTLVVVWKVPYDYGFNFDEKIETVKTASRFNGAVVTEEDGNKYLSFSNPTAEHRLVFPTNCVVVPANDLEGYYIRMRLSDTTAHLQFNYWGEGGVQNGNNGGSYTVVDGTIAANEWFTVYYDASTITDGSIGKDSVSIQEDGFTYLRIDLNNVSGVTWDVDYVKFISKRECINATLVMDETSAPTEKLSYTAAATLTSSSTASEILAAVDYSDYNGVKYPYAVLIDGEFYEGDDVVGGYIEAGDNVTVAWRELNILAGIECDEVPAAGAHVVGGGTVVAADGVITYTRTQGSTSGGFFGLNGLSVPVSDIYDIQVRVKMPTGLNQEYGSVYAGLTADGTQKNDSLNMNFTVTGNDEWQVISLLNKFGTLNWTHSNVTIETLTAFRAPQFRYLSGYNASTAADMPGYTVEYDYIRIIGYPEYVIEVDAGELGTLIGTYTEKTTVAKFIESLEYPVGAKVITGIEEAEADTDLVADLVAENGTLTATLEDNEWYGEYGIKVFSVDFDDATAGALTSGTTLSALGASVNPDFGTSVGNATLSYANSYVEIVEGEDGNYYKLTANADGGNSYTCIDARSCSGYFTTKAGHYILTYNSLAGENLQPTVLAFNKSHLIEENPHSVVCETTANEWGTVAFYYPKNERYYNAAQTQYIDSMADVNILMMRNKNTCVDDVICLDNITLWWIPSSVEATIDVGDDNAEAVNTTVTIDNGATTIADLAAYVYGGKKVASGFALDGDALDAEKPLIFMNDVTLTVTGWEDIAYLEEWGAEFDTDAGYSYMTFTGTENADSYGSAVYGSGNENGVDYITWNENGYITLSYDVSAEHKASAEAAGATPVVYDSVLYITGLDNTPESHTASGSYIKAGTVKQIQMRYRYNGEVLEAGDTYCKADGTTGTIAASGNASFVPYVYYWNSAASAKNAYPFSSITTAGEWIVGTFEASVVGADANDLYVLRIDLPDTMPDGSSFDIDYIRFLGDVAQAPVSLIAATAARENKTGETYTNAIRYMATVNAVTKTRANDIGWLVSTEAYLGTDALTFDKYVEGSNRVKVAYQKQDKEDVINYYNTDDDDATVFAAFVYNIPEKNALDNIVVRPFVKSGSKYLYGDAMVTNLYEMLKIADYVTFAEGYTDIEGVRADGWDYENAFADEVDGEVVTPFMAYNAAYAELDAEKQEYIDAVLRAVLG